MSQFRLAEGTAVVATPTKSQYTSVEQIVINIRCTVERDGPWLPGQWWIRYTASDINGVNVFDDSTTHSTTETRVSDAMSMTLAPLPAGTYPLTIVVSAHDLGD